jgi:Tfp pilus assembly protein PilO
MAIKLSKQQQQYLGAGAFFFVIGSVLYVQFFWRPWSQKMSDLEDEITKIDQKISEAKTHASRLDRLQADLAMLSQEAVEAERRLPKAESIPDVLVKLSSLTQQNHLSISAFSPGSSNNKISPFFIELSYPMTVKGTFNNIGRFFAAVALEERIFNVKDVSFPSAGSDGEMTVTFTLLTYQYNKG